MDYDFSTLNEDELSKLPVYKVPPSYTVDTHMGNGCAFDPPGYPTYFTQSVYTRFGNTPNRGATLLLRGHAVDVAEWKEGDTWELRTARQDRLMRRLYVPLPYEHPRVEAWERDLYTHLAHCYTDTEGVFEPEYGRPALVIYPTPYYKLRRFHDDPRFSDEWRTKERAAIEQANREIEAKHAAVAKPEKHAAVRRIRQMYPDAPIRMDWIAEPPARWGNWYERYAERPTPQNCPGDRSVRLPHIDGRWCQFCGYTNR